MKMPKKPKKGKAPKKPKATASASAWLKFDERYKSFEKKEREKLATYNKKVAAIKSAKSRKEQLIKKYAH